MSSLSSSGGVKIRSHCSGLMYVLQLATRSLRLSGDLCTVMAMFLLLGIPKEVLTGHWIIS